ncbi:MAG: ribonuclease HI [bacterium]|nr:ribonuclease HI [bacterium]MCY4271820.1 ribonuclease HI [bacterium]
MTDFEKPTIVYTDGACRGNPGPGGWGWVVPNGLSDSGGAVQTTNNRMELKAVLEALSALEGAVEVHCDSTYVVNCFRDQWWQGWIRRKWKTADGKAVSNQDLWMSIIEQVQRRPVEFRWVKGHSGDRWNDEADRLATEAADGQDMVQEQSLF